MPVTDPIADMLTRIRNAIGAKHGTVTVPSSRMKMSLAKILKEEGFVQDFEISDQDSKQDEIKISLHYRDRNECAISGLKRVSTPGLRVYVRKGEIPRYYGGLGVSIISTSKGVMTGQNAWKYGLGGELLCYIW